MVGIILINRKPMYCIQMELCEHLSTVGPCGTYVIRFVCHYQPAGDSGSLRSKQLSPKQIPAWFFIQ